MTKRDSNDPKWWIPSGKHKKMPIYVLLQKSMRVFDTPHLDIKLSSTFILIKTRWNETSLQLVSPPNTEYRKMDLKRVLPTLKTSSSQASAEVKRCWGSTLDGWSPGEIGILSFFFFQEKLTCFCEKRKHGNTICVAMMCCVFNENSFQSCFLCFLEASRCVELDTELLASRHLTTRQMIW